MPLESITVPEDHVRRVKVLKSGFALFFDALRHAMKEEAASTLAERREARRGTIAAFRLQKRLSVAKYAVEERLSRSVKGRSGKNSAKETLVDECAVTMFKKMDKDGQGFVTEEQFTRFLGSIGFFDWAGQTIALAGEQNIMINHFYFDFTSHIDNFILSSILIV